MFMLLQPITLLFSLYLKTLDMHFKVCSSGFATRLLAEILGDIVLTFRVQYQNIIFFSETTFTEFLNIEHN